MRTLFSSLAVTIVFGIVCCPHAVCGQQAPPSPPPISPLVLPITGVPPPGTVITTEETTPNGPAISGNTLNGTVQVQGVFAGSTPAGLATPEPLMGRVNSVYLLASVGGAAIGSALGGVLAQQFGLAAPFAIAFVAMVLMTTVAWRPLRHVSVRADKGLAASS